MRRVLIACLARLFVVQFLAWTGMFALWIYTTPVVIERLSPGVASDDPAYLAGLTWVGWCFAAYALLAAILNFAQPIVFAAVGRNRSYAASLSVGALGIALVPYGASPAALLGCFALIGIAWSAISTVPYAIVAEVAQEAELRRAMNILGFSVVLPQVVAVLLFGILTRTLFAGHVAMTMELGAGAMALAAFAVLLLGVGANAPDSRSAPGTRGVPLDNWDR